MFNLERAIADWRRQLRAAGIDSSVTLDELESHLRDDMEARRRLGLSEAEAFAAAVREIGSAGSLGREFEKNPLRREVAARMAKILVVGVAGSALLTGVGAIFKLPLSLELPLSGFAFAVVLTFFVWMLRTAGLSAIRRGALLDLSLLTAGAKRSLDAARTEAARFHHDFIGTEHALLGLFAVSDGTVARVLWNCGLERQTVLREVEKFVGIGPMHETARELPCTPRLTQAVQLAAREARALKLDRVGAEHLLLGLLVEGRGVASLVLKNLGVSLEALRAAILREAGEAGGEPAGGS